MENDNTVALGHDHGIIGIPSNTKNRFDQARITSYTASCLALRRRVYREAVRVATTKPVSSKSSSNPGISESEIDKGRKAQKK